MLIINFHSISLLLSFCLLPCLPTLFLLTLKYTQLSLLYVCIIRHSYFHRLCYRITFFITRWKLCLYNYDYFIWRLLYQSVSQLAVNLFSRYCQLSSLRTQSWLCLDTMYTVESAFLLLVRGRKINKRGGWKFLGANPLFGKPITSRSVLMKRSKFLFCHFRINNADIPWGTTLVCKRDAWKRVEGGDMNEEQVGFVCSVRMLTSTFRTSLLPVKINDEQWNKWRKRR
jgi:hypothetical protein